MLWIEKPKHLPDKTASLELSFFFTFWQLNEVKDNICLELLSSQLIFLILQMLYFLFYCEKEFFLDGSVCREQILTIKGQIKTSF